MVLGRRGWGRILIICVCVGLAALSAITIKSVVQKPYSVIIAVPPATKLSVPVAAPASLLDVPVEMSEDTALIADVPPVMRAATASNRSPVPERAAARSDETISTPTPSLADAPTRAETETSVPVVVRALPPATSPPVAIVPTRREAQPAPSEEVEAPRPVASTETEREPSQRSTVSQSDAALDVLRDVRPR